MTITNSSVPPVAAPVRQGSAQRLGRMDRYQPFILLGSMVVGLTLAQVAPSIADVLSSVVPVGVFILIYLVMLGVNGREVASVFAQRRFLTLAIGINFVVNPVLAWALAQVFLAGQPDLRVGLILFLVTPCIGWYLVFTELAEGDAGLGVGLLGINIVLQVLLLPVYLALFVGASAAVDLDEIGRSILTYLVGPAALAAMTRAAVGRSSIGIETVRETIGRAQLKTAALIIVIVAMFASQAEVLRDNPTTVVRLLVPMTAFFVVGFLIAIAAGRIAGLSYQQTALLVFTTTSRNSEASLAIAATAFASPLVALTVVIGPIIELPLLVVMTRVLRARRPTS